MSHLTPDIPHSAGMKNALRRAEQLAKLRWTPIRPFPASIKSEVAGERHLYSVFLPAWRPQIGANYSAARFDEKYIGINVSLETYMTALSNPRSVLYTRTLHGRAPLSSAYYGTVCSEFASYVLDLPFHIDCQQWPFLENIESVVPEPLENLQLCDILNEPTRHTAVITGIDRDEDGRIVQITVTESTLPRIQSCVYSRKEFTEYWLNNGYEVLRDKRLHRVTYTPDPWVHVDGDPAADVPIPNPILMPDLGNRANYLLGEPITISVFDEAYTEIELCKDGEAAYHIKVENGEVILHSASCGFYRATAVSKTEGNSQPIEFCVVDASVRLDKASYRAQEPMEVSCENPSNDRLLGWVIKTDAYAKVWGYLVREDGSLPACTAPNRGKYLIIALYKNAYGVYSSRPSSVFEVSGDEQHADSPPAH